MIEQTIANAIQRFKESCNQALNEEGIKMACRDFMSKVGEIFGIEIKSSAEVTSFHGGRTDSIYNDVYFEFKDLGLFEKKAKGSDEALYGRNDFDHGLFHYLINHALDECHKDDALFKTLLFRKVGVAFDGRTFYFCRFKKSNKTINIHNENKTKRFPKSISKEINAEFEVVGPLGFDDGVKRVLLYVRSATKKMLDAPALSLAFSPSSPVTKKTVPYLYNLLENALMSGSSGMRIQTLYNEWHRIFGTIYNEEKSDFVKHVSAIKKVYDIASFSGKVDVIKALFIIQTYYSIIIKLLVQNLFASLKLPTHKSSAISTFSDVVGLFYGSKDNFNDYIDNFYELNFFEWFTFTKDFDPQVINDIM